MNDRLINFLKIVSSKLPGCLAVFDFADFKRRNCHLGYLAGDKDIEEFESVLNSILSGTDPRLRIAGDKWAVFTSENNLGKINTIIDSFVRSEQVKVGWICKGSLNGRTQQNTTTITSTLSRSVRCAYLRVVHPESLAADIEKLTDYTGGCEVNVPQPFSTETTDQPNRWTCITYPSDKRACIFCGHDQFEYLGDPFGPILSMECTCKRCGAHLEFQEIFETSSFGIKSQ